MTPKHDAAHPDLYTALNDAGDLRPAARVVLEHFMGALIERPLIEVAVERYLGCHGPEALTDVVIANPLAWVLAYFDSQQ